MAGSARELRQVEFSVPAVPPMVPAGHLRCFARNLGRGRHRRRVGDPNGGFDHRPGAFSGSRRKRGIQNQGFGRSRGGFTSKVHCRCDAIGRPVAFEVTGGEASDIRHLEPLMDDPVAIAKPKAPLGDKGYDSDSNREALLVRGILPVIPSKRSRKVIIPHDEVAYKDRNRIERMINKLKQNRRIATRFDKTLSSFTAFISLAAIRIWLPTFVNRT